jgi:hypothetical protein
MLGDGCTAVIVHEFTTVANLTLRKVCHLKDQMTDNQTYFINSTKNIINSQFTASTEIRQLSYLYWIYKYKRVERRTWNAIVNPVFSAVPSHG